MTAHARDGQIIPDGTARYVYDLIGNLATIHHANGVISEHVYDLLNRLASLTHTSGGDILQRYDYAYYGNGDKSGETFTDAAGNTHSSIWLYDALGRLVRETHDNHDDSLDYSTGYTYDLVGNRVGKSTDLNGDGVADEVIVSEYDENDRLLNEMTLFNGAGTSRTDYSYAGTEQTGKRVTDLQTNTLTSETVMEYNEQGRLRTITITTYSGGEVVKVVTQEYEYDSSGLKVRETETVTGAAGAVDGAKETEYLYDRRNPTGYAQVLEETESVEGEAVRVTTYTIGHAVLSQYSAQKGLLTLLTDGHGSTRAVTDASGKVVQEYSYDAYGNAHGFDASEALTTILYSGQQTNPVSGLQYLRARWYNPQSGRFTRLDPFAGNKESPLSFHKYAYGHMNPVTYTDPSGELVLSTTGAILIGILSLGAVLGVAPAVAGKIKYTSAYDSPILLLGGAPLEAHLNTTWHKSNTLTVDTVESIYGVFAQRILTNNSVHGKDGWKFKKITIIGHGHEGAAQITDQLGNKDYLTANNADVFKVLQGYTDSDTIIEFRNCFLGGGKQGLNLMTTVANHSGATVQAYTGPSWRAGIYNSGEMVEVNSPVKKSFIPVFPNCVFVV